MLETIEVQRLSVGSVYKLFAISIVCFLVPAAFIAGIFAFFGADTITWNGQHLKGLTGLIASPFIGLLISFIFTVLFGTGGAIGLWLFSKVHTLKLSIRTIPLTAGRPENSTDHGTTEKLND